MAMETLILRLAKGSPLTAQEMDDNLQILYDGVNALESIMGVAMNPDGTLKTGVVNTASIVNRAVTQPKLALNSALVAIATYVDPTYTIDFTPAITDVLALGAGTGATFYVRADATNASTPTNLKVGTNAALPLKKYNGANVDIGDIRAGDVFIAVYNGTDFSVFYPSRPYNFQDIQTGSKAGTGTALGAADTKILDQLSLSLPAGCTKWTYMKLVFGGMFNNYGTEYPSIDQYKVYDHGAGTQIAGLVDNIATGGWYGDTLGNLDGPAPAPFTIIAEGPVPAGCAGNDPIVFDAYARYVAGWIGGDLASARKFYAACWAR